MALKSVYENMDKLITSDLNKRGVIQKLYKANRKQTKIPMTMLAAKRITAAVKKGDTVIITTGFLIPPKNIQETDGPAGVAALARIFGKIFNANTLIVTEPAAVKILTASLHGIGIKVVAPWQLANAKTKNSAAVIGISPELRAIAKKAKTLFNKYNPSMVLAIEKAGCNKNGEYHTMRGLNVSALHIKIEPLLEEAKRRGILRVGIGDGGNEVGMGNLKDAVEKFVPYGKKCQCGCGGGITAESNVDALIMASVSNLGAYGVEASLAYLTGKKEAIHTSKLERSVIRHMVAAGAIDGVTGRNEISVDGAPFASYLAVIDKLNALVRHSKNH